MIAPRDATIHSLNCSSQVTMSSKFKIIILPPLIALVSACSSSHPLARNSMGTTQTIEHPVGDDGKSKWDDKAWHHLHAYAVGNDSPYFEKRSDVINAKAREVLVQNAKLILRYGIRFRIVGHANNCDDEESNQRLSLRRAENVRHELLDLGVREELIVSVTGMGSSNPLSNTSPSCDDWFNDRVELNVVDLQTPNPH